MNFSPDSPEEKWAPHMVSQLCVFVTVTTRIAAAKNGKVSR
jgi:hypothetical protein